METTAASIYDIPVTTIDGLSTTLDSYRGRVLLIVNVASKCSFTPQYAGLEALYQNYKDRGLVVLGFPCNQFLWQEPGDPDAIKSVCSLKYNVTFPIFMKVNVNGSDTHPLYRLLKKSAPGSFGTQSVKWNFTKFLVDREGNTVRRFGPTVVPQNLASAVEPLLG